MGDDGIQPVTAYLSAGKLYLTRAEALTKAAEAEVRASLSKKLGKGLNWELYGWFLSETIAVLSNDCVHYGDLLIRLSNIRHQER